MGSLGAVLNLGAKAMELIESRNGYQERELPRIINEKAKDVSEAVQHILRHAFDNDRVEPVSQRPSWASEITRDFFSKLSKPARESLKDAIEARMAHLNNTDEDAEYELDEAAYDQLSELLDEYPALGKLISCNEDKEEHELTRKLAEILAA